MEPNNQEGEEKLGGALFTSVMIILILVVGGIYLIREKIRIANEIKTQQEQIKNANQY